MFQVCTFISILKYWKSVCFHLCSDQNLISFRYCLFLEFCNVLCFSLLIFEGNKGKSKILFLCFTDVLNYGLLFSLWSRMVYWKLSSYWRIFLLFFFLCFLRKNFIFSSQWFLTFTWHLKIFSIRIFPFPWLLIPCFDISRGSPSLPSMEILIQRLDVNSSVLGQHLWWWNFLKVCSSIS